MELTTYVILHRMKSKLHGNKSRSRTLYTNTKSFVDIQQYLFDNLCNNAILAREKIKEIERGIRNDFADTVNQPAEIRKIVTNQLMSTRD